jgi:hypothetical protein
LATTPTASERRSKTGAATPPSPSASFGILWTLKLWGIRVEEEAETSGLDVSEHGMWGYPEFYIPVPGGYGTEAYAHVGNNVGSASRTTAEPGLGSTS